MNMFSLQNRYLFSFVVVVLVVFLASSLCDGRLVDKVNVKVINGLSDGKDLNVHCKSGDDDLGPRRLRSNQFFDFSFGLHFFGKTLFFCRFWWGNEAHWFDIYDDPRDEHRCLERCWWVVKENGPCLLNSQTGEYDLCAEWNK